MLERDLGVPVGNRFQIGRWSEQGVLLLNTTLSVRAGEPESHKVWAGRRLLIELSVSLPPRKSQQLFALGCSRAEKSVLVNGPHKSGTNGSASITAERLSRIL